MVLQCLAVQCAVKHICFRSISHDIKLFCKMTSCNGEDRFWLQLMLDQSPHALCRRSTWQSLSNTEKLVLKSSQHLQLVPGSKQGVSQWGLGQQE